MNRTMNPMSKRSRTLLPLLLALGAAGVTLPATGCGVFQNTMVAEPGPRYPSDMARGEVFDVQVFRRVTKLRFTNTTPIDFGPSRVWLNRRYSSTIGGLESGQTLELSLLDFVDEFGDVYRAGGFFSQRVPAPVVLVELETGEDDAKVLHGFVVVENQLD